MKEIFRWSFKKKEEILFVDKNRILREFINFKFKTSILLSIFELEICKIFKKIKELTYGLLITK